MASEYKTSVGRGKTFALNEGEHAAVREWHGKLESALGKPEFNSVMNAAARDARMSQAASTELSSRFLAPIASSTSKNKAFSQIAFRHNKLIESRSMSAYIGSPKGPTGDFSNMKSTVPESARAKLEPAPKAPKPSTKAASSPSANVKSILADLELRARLGGTAEAISHLESSNLSAADLKGLFKEAKGRSAKSGADALRQIKEHLAGVSQNALRTKNMNEVFGQHSSQHAPKGFANPEVQKAAQLAQGHAAPGTGAASKVAGTEIKAAEAASKAEGLLSKFGKGKWALALAGLTALGTSALAGGKAYAKGDDGLAAAGDSLKASAQGFQNMSARDAAELALGFTPLGIPLAVKDFAQAAIAGQGEGGKGGRGRGSSVAAPDKAQEVTPGLVRLPSGKLVSKESLARPPLGGPGAPVMKDGDAAPMASVKAFAGRRAAHAQNAHAQAASGGSPAATAAHEHVQGYYARRGGKMVWNKFSQQTLDDRQQP